MDHPTGAPEESPSAGPDPSGRATREKPELPMSNVQSQSLPHNGGSQWEALPRDGVKDTIDSVVVAFVLAFVFRAFLVEAFIIPTGSMAPTLYGAHATIVCEDCGTEFAYGLKDSSIPAGLGDVKPSHKAICPNCNHPNTTLKTNDRKRNYEKGDRILVFKWPFSFGSSRPGAKRWDVVVFKNPANGSQNYIKRLVGMPGEVLMIVDGDIYTVPTDQLSQGTLRTLDLSRREKYELRTEARKGPMRSLPQPVFDEIIKRMTITRKTPLAQEALWFRVYDNDCPPKTPSSGQPTWKAAMRSESGWDTSGRRVRFEDRGATDDYIVLTGEPLRSKNAYNIATDARARRVPPVSDLRVRFVLTPKTDSGVLHMRLAKNEHVFWATLNTNGDVAITESFKPPSESSSSMLSARVAPLAVDRPIEVAFEHLDYRVALYVDGEEVLATSMNPESKGYYAPDLAELLAKRAKHSNAAPPCIYAGGGNLDLTHLVVERDVHYTSPHPNSWPKWATAGGWGTVGNPILLRSWEYFMLGDNSAASQDSRLWLTVGPHLTDRGEDYQLGTVPADQLIGKAFFVYWPSGLRIPWLPPLDRIGIVPDVGRMRWIR